MNIGRVGIDLYNINTYSKDNSNNVNNIDKANDVAKENKTEEKVVNVPVASQKFNSNDYSGLYDKDREYILGENDVSLEKLDIQKAVSDMKKDQILEQYQFFVRPSNEDNKTNSFLAELEDFDL